LDLYKDKIKQLDSQKTEEEVMPKKDELSKKLDFEQMSPFAGAASGGNTYDSDWL
jgi:hypothetical protein